MPDVHLVGQLASLKELIANVEKAANGDINLMGHWGNYLCVLTAGYLENGLRSVYSDFVQNSASPHVARFSVSILESVTNPRANRFVEIARRFNPDWASGLEIYLYEDNERRKKRGRFDNELIVILSHMVSLRPLAWAVSNSICLTASKLLNLFGSKPRERTHRYDRCQCREGGATQAPIGSLYISSSVVSLGCVIRGAAVATGFFVGSHGKHAIGV